MPLGLRATAAPYDLTSSYATPEENAAAAMQAEQERLAGMNALTRGLGRGLYQTPASLANVAAQVVEPISPDTAQPMYDWATQQNTIAQGMRLPTDITDTSQIRTLADAGNYVGGMVGENLPNAAVSIPLGIAATAALPEVAGAGALATAARVYAGQTLAATPLNMGEQVQRLRDDPYVMANTTPEERLANAAGHGVVGGALEGAGNALLVGRLGGAGKGVTKTLFKDGVGAATKSAAAHTALAVPEAAITEGVPEALQEKSGQLFHSALNPTRDTTQDLHDLGQSFFSGWAAGGPSNVVGRGANVAYANTRDGMRAGAEFLGNASNKLDAAMQKLRQPKTLPPNLTTSDDQTIYDWDQSDNAERNAAASEVANSIMADDKAPSYLREKAAEFYERAKAGMSDAWQSLSEGLQLDDRFQRGKDGVEHFLDAFKKTNAEFSGKANVESDAADAVMYPQFRAHLDNRSKTARDTELSSRLYNTVKQSLLDDSWHELPWHALEDEFGTIGKATAAVVQLRDNLVRAGQLDHDSEFSKLIEATTLDGQQGERAKMDVVQRYAALEHGKVDDSTARQLVRRIGDSLSQYSNWDAKKRASFDKDMQRGFGANAEKVLEALRPKQELNAEGDLEDTKSEGSQQTLSEVEAAGARFVGQATKKALGAEAGVGGSVSAHGGMWNLGHSKKETRDSIRQKMEATKAALVADGNTVRTLTPLEYAKEAGISPGKVAQSLGTSVKLLDSHPARMLMVTREQQVGLRDDGTEFTKEAIASLGDTTRYGQAPYESKLLAPEQVAEVKAALSKKGRAQREALEKLGLANGVKLEQTPKGAKLINNLNHGGNGRFTVVMKDGSSHVISAQELISTMRKRTGSRGTALQHFNAGVAAIMANKDVASIKVHDVWGREHKTESGDSLGVFGPHFRIEPDLSLGKAQKATQKGAAKPDAVDVAAARVEVAEKKLIEAEEKGAAREKDATDRVEAAEEKLSEAEAANEDVEEARNELEAALDNLGEVQDEISAKVEEARNELEDAKDELAAAEAEQAEYEGEGERPGVVGEKVAKDDDATPLDREGAKPLDFNDDGTPKHPYGKDSNTIRSTTPVKSNGITLRLRNGVSTQHVTPAMAKTLRLISKAYGIVSARRSTLDVAADYVARAAAAQRDGNQKARNALLLTAQHRLWSALVDEANTLGDAHAGEMTPERRALIQAAAVVAKPAAEYVENADKVKKAAQGYEAFVERAPKTTGTAAERKVAADRYAHHADFLSTLEGKTNAEIKADGIARKARIAGLEALTSLTENQQHLLDLMRQENDMARDELKARMGGKKAEAKSSTEAAKSEGPKANDLNPLHKEAPSAYVSGKKAKAEAEAFDKLVDNLVGAGKAAKELGGNLKAAFRTLLDAIENGELNKPELVANLREAMKNLRSVVEQLGAAAAEGMSRITKAVQQKIREYREGGAEPAVKHNAESSYATGGSVTEADMQAAREYIDKVLGPQVKLLLSKDLGGDSAQWERVDGEAVIRIAVSSLNPMSKAHHEAMHEFFQRLSETNPELAAVLSRAASSAPVVRQIKMFFSHDANFSKIKEALNDPHERVAYMYQLWAAGKLNLGPKTEGVFAKVAKFMRKVTGMMRSADQAEALMQHFHDGAMSTPSDVAKVLLNDQKLKAAYANKVASVGNPLYQRARELLITAQNELLDSGNKGLEKIGRMFTNETGAADNDIAFLSARVQKTNQMTDRLVNILNGVSEKEALSALEGLQRGDGTRSGDSKVAEVQNRVAKMLKDIHTYLKQAGVNINEVENYFPRAWDPVSISENQEDFTKLLMKDGNIDEATATRITKKLIENRGAEPLTEGEYRVGYSPFMAAANKRMLDFIKSPEFVKYQQKDLTNILVTYISHAVHRAEYSRRFGEHGEGLRKMVKDAIGEQVGAEEWASSEKREEEKLAEKKKELKEKFKGDPNGFKKAMIAAGYPNGEVSIDKIAAGLNEPTLKKFVAFRPQLRRIQRSIMAMEGTLGADVNPLIRKMTAGIIVYENMRLLTMSLFSQIIDPFGVIVRGGTVDQGFETLKRGLQGVVAGWRGKPLEDNMTKLAMQLGIIDAGNFLNSQGQAYSSVFMGKTAKWFNDRLFRWNGVEGFSQGARVGAMLAAISFIKTHSDPKTANQHSERYLKELGLTAKDVELADGELDYTNKKIQDAIFRWVEGAILRPNAAMRPAWSSDPHYALLFHMKQFTYAMQKVLLERVAHEAQYGNYNPAMAMLATVPAIIASDFLRGLISNGGKEPPWKRNWTFSDYLQDGVQRAGLLGIPQLGFDVAKWGPGELTGPFGEQLIRTAKNYDRAYDKDARLDEKALMTGDAADKELAEQYNWIEHGTKKNLRMALPMGEFAKKAVYDPLTQEIK